MEGYSRSGQAVAGAEGTAVDLSNTGELVTIINSHDVTIIAVSAGRGVSAEPVIQAHKALIAAKPSGRLLIVGGAVLSKMPRDSGLSIAPDSPKSTRPRHWPSAKSLTNTVHLQD